MTDDERDDVTRASVIAHVASEADVPQDTVSAVVDTLWPQLLHTPARDLVAPIARDMGISEEAARRIAGLMWGHAVLVGMRSKESKESKLVESDYMIALKA